MKSRKKNINIKNLQMKKKKTATKRIWMKFDRKSPMRMKIEKNNSKQNKSQLKELESNLKY
jgi:hypothetical protein